ncbi:MAG: DUF3293 domain-containing protein [Acidimicrobiales bacterium]
MRNGQFSPIPSLRNLVERTMTVGDLVSDPLWTLDPTQSAPDAAAVLAARDFDLAGVAEEPLARYVTRHDLVSSDGTVADVARPILAADAVEMRLALADVVSILRLRPYVFVLDHSRVRWLVTCADLQAPTVGVVALAYLVAIEVGLVPLVVDFLGDNWPCKLPPARHEKALQLYDQKRADNTATGLEDCLYFSDWLSLVACSQPLLDRLGFQSRKRFDDETGVFTDLRNRLAHGATLLDGATPNQAIDRFQRIRSFADTVWELVEDRSERWDAYATTVISTAEGSPLSGPGAVEIPFAAPVHIITAWNPGSITRSPQANRDANVELARLLKNHELAPIPVVGASPDRSWHEESLLVEGLSRRAAAELGERFGQLAVFELTGEELLVLRCPDANVMRRIARHGRS